MALIVRYAPSMLPCNDQQVKNILPIQESMDDLFCPECFVLPPPAFGTTFPMDATMTAASDSPDVCEVLVRRLCRKNMDGQHIEAPEELYGIFNPKIITKALRIARRKVKTAAVGKILRMPKFITSRRREHGKQCVINAKRRRRGEMFNALSKIVEESTNRSAVVQAKLDLVTLCRQWNAEDCNMR